MSIEVSHLKRPTNNVINDEIIKKKQKQSDLKPIALIIRSLGNDPTINSPISRIQHEKLSETHKIIVSSSDDKSYLKQIIKTISNVFNQAPKVLIFEMHGNSESIKFSKTSSYSIHDVEEHQFSDLDPNATIILQSCETGKNLAQKISDVSKRTVIAPVEKTAFCNTRLYFCQTHQALELTSQSVQSKGISKQVCRIYKPLSNPQMPCMQPPSANELISTLEAIVAKNRSPEFLLELAGLYSRTPNPSFQLEETIFKLLLEATAKNYPPAFYFVGLFYQTNAHYKDIQKAFNAFEEGAKLGNNQCKFELGKCYMLGLGTIQDTKIGIKLYEEAANQDNADAEYRLAICYLTGVGVTADLKMGLELLWRASNKEHKEAQYLLATTYLSQRETREQGFKLLEQLAEKGHREAQYDLSNYIFNHMLVVNYTKGLNYLAMAANQGHPNAQYDLGLSLMEEGTPEKHIEGFKYLKMAADQGHPNAQYDLAVSFFNGIGTRVDEKEGYKYLEMSAKQGDMDAQYEFAGRTLSRSGDNNLRVAFEFFEKAANKGHLEAQYQLALCYLNGIGTAPNKDLGTHLLKEAQKKGHNGAQELLKACTQLINLHKAGKPKSKFPNKNNSL